MPDKKLTDSEITIKALKELLEVMLSEGDLQRTSTISHTIDLIDRLQAENERLKKSYLRNQEIFAEQSLENERLKAEIERLKNAYKQVAWERDIFAEDMKQEIKKDCSYLMLDIKTIKAKAYEKFIDKFLEKAISTRNYFEIKSLARTVLNELVGEDK